MGDELDAIDENPDELTKEEQAILDGEKAEEKGEKSEKDGEQEAAAEKEKEAGAGELEAEDESKTKTQIRIDDLTRDRKTAEEKLDLFKRDQESYYQKYPDEKPAEAATETQATAAANLVVTGGKYDGQTLQQIMDVDQLEGMRLMLEYNNAQQAEATEAKKESVERLEKSNQDIDAFKFARAKELFDGKEKDYTQEQLNAIEGTVKKTLDWIDLNSFFDPRAPGSLDAAYFLMNRDKDLAKAGSIGAKSIADQATRGPVATISSNASSGTETGYDADMAMSDDELADKIDAMSDSAYTDWKSKAPEELKKKHSEIAW